MACNNHIITNSSLYDYSEYKLNYSLKLLSKTLSNFTESLFYYYFIKSVKFHNDQFIQTDCGPNLEGGAITLCTCKHYLRTFSKIQKDTWIAGITLKEIGDHNGNYLFYLGKIKNVYLSHEQMWNSLQLKLRYAKNASIHVNGDIYCSKGTNDEYTYL